MLIEGHLMLVVGGLLAAAVIVSLAAARLRIPALILFVAVGVAVGSDGAGWVEFDKYALTRDTGIAALALILFDGGLSVGLKGIRSVLGPAVRLAVGATVIVAVIAGVAASVLLGLSVAEGLLLGSMLAATDSAAVFGLLRGSTLSSRLVRTMEAESGLNDAVAFVLVIGFVSLVQDPGRGPLDIAFLIVREFAFGTVCGGIVGWLGAAALSRARLPVPGLYAVASLAVAGLAYGTAESVRGSGLVAVFLAALVLADAQLPARQSIAVFHGGLAWVAQVALFLMLGLLVSPSRLGGVLSDGILLGLVVVAVARPLATMAATTAREFTARERIVLSWAELLGATPLLLATVAVASGVAGGERYFDVVFVAVGVSTLLQGLTFEPLARALGLTRVVPLLPRPLVEFGAARSLGAEMVEYPVTAADAAVGRHVRDLELPLGIGLVLIIRGGEAVPPRDSVRLSAGDELHFLVREEVADRIPELLELLHAPRAEPPIGARPAGDGGLSELVVEPWTAVDGDLVDPDVLAGSLVVERLRARRDHEAALVRLEDGRYGVTGRTIAVGPAAALRRYAQRRLSGALSGLEAAWWQEVASALRR